MQTFWLELAMNSKDSHIKLVSDLKKQKKNNSPTVWVIVIMDKIHKNINMQIL